MSDVEIRPIELEHLDQVAWLHLQAFPGSLLSQLGHAPVRRYYHWQLTGPHDANAFGAFHGEKLVGFAFGGLYRDRMRGFLRKNLIFLTCRLLLNRKAMRHPALRNRIAVALRAMRRRSQTRPPEAMTGDSQITARRPYGVLALAVTPAFRKRGLGRKLMLEHESRAIQGGFERMRLSVEVNNEGAIRFYKGIGWTKVLVDGEWTGVMHRPLSPVTQQVTETTGPVRKTKDKLVTT